VLCDADQSAKTSILLKLLDLLVRYRVEVLSTDGNSFLVDSLGSIGMLGKEMHSKSQRIGARLISSLDEHGSYYY
jgi:hypothetical protein